MRLMTVGHLRKLIEKLPDETRVLQPASDHSYGPVIGEVGTALLDPESRTWTEDFGEDMTPESEYGKRFDVLILK